VKKFQSTLLVIILLLPIFVSAQDLSDVHIRTLAQVNGYSDVVITFSFQGDITDFAIKSFETTLVAAVEDEIQVIVYLINDQVIAGAEMTIDPWTTPGRVYLRIDSSTSFSGGGFFLKVIMRHPGVNLYQFTESYLNGSPIYIPPAIIASKADLVVTDIIVFNSNSLEPVYVDSLYVKSGTSLEGSFHLYNAGSETYMYKYKYVVTRDNDTLHNVIKDDGYLIRPQALLHYRLPEFIFYPDGSGLYTISVEVNFDESVDESDYTNNRLERQIYINVEHPLSAGGGSLATPEEFTLHQNYPNPFNSSTIISFELKNPGHVVLNVYNTNGQLVKELVDREMSSGKHTANWDGMNNYGQYIATGIYICRMTTDRHTQNIKINFTK